MLKTISQEPEHVGGFIPGIMRRSSFLSSSFSSLYLIDKDK